MSNDAPNAPGVYRGRMRLSSTHDVENCYNELLAIINGPEDGPNSGAVSENGYVPWKMDAGNKIDYSAMFPELVAELQKKNSIAISKDNVFLSDMVRELEFEGKLVTVDIGDDGIAHIKIDESNDLIARFNETTTFSTAAVKIVTDVVDGMIVPDSTGLQNVYGDWNPGKVVRGFNSTGIENMDNVEFITAGPVKATYDNSRFQVKIYDGDMNVIYDFLSLPIEEGHPEDVKLGNARVGFDITTSIFIKNLLKREDGWSFEPRFVIDLSQVFHGNTSRFQIEIIHLDGETNKYTYITEPFIFNAGRLPIISNTIVAVNDDSSTEGYVPAVYQYSSGVRYITKGQVRVNINAVGNLNNGAAVENKFNCLPNEFVSSARFIPDTYTLGINNVSNWKMIFDLKPDVMTFGECRCNIEVFNAFGKADYFVDIPMALNTITDPERSTDLKETFADESMRLTNDFTTMWDSEAPINTYDSCAALQVIPNYGLIYPSVDYTPYLPKVGQPNYSIASDLTNWKFFNRIFRSKNANLKYGGIFVFENLTKADFFNERIQILISADNGTNWLSLKHVRNTNNYIAQNSGSSVLAKGILTDIWEKDGKLYVEWSYPETKSSREPLFFKLGMNATSTYCIKSIQLLNINGTEEW